MGNIRQETSQNVKDFCNTSSAHGVGYFFSNFSTLSRFFWVLVTFSMAVVCIIWVIHINKQWSNNPIKLVTETVSAPIEDTQFPTITICNNFAADKWAFVKNLANLMKFKCYDDATCAETEPARTLFARERNSNAFPLNFKNLREIVTTAVSTDRGKYFYHGRSQNIKMIEAALWKMFSNNNTAIEDFLKDIWVKKMTCKMDNFQFYKLLGVSPRYHGNETGNYVVS